MVETRPFLLLLFRPRNEAIIVYQHVSDLGGSETCKLEWPYWNNSDGMLLVSVPFTPWIIHYLHGWKCFHNLYVTKIQTLTSIRAYIAHHSQASQIDIERCLIQNHKEQGSIYVNSGHFLCWSLHGCRYAQSHKGCGLQHKVHRCTVVYQGFEEAPVNTIWSVVLVILYQSQMCKVNVFSRFMSHQCPRNFQWHTSCIWSSNDNCLELVQRHNWFSSSFLLAQSLYLCSNIS